MQPTALVIDDRATGRRAHRQALEALGWQVLTASTLTEAAGHVEAKPLFVVTDLNLTEDEHGPSTAYRVQDMFPTADVAVVTASTDDPMAMAELQAAGIPVHAAGELGWMPRAPTMSEQRSDGWIALLDNPATRATVMGMLGFIGWLGMGEIQDIRGEISNARAKQALMETWFHEEQLRTRESLSKFKEDTGRDLGAIRESLARLAASLERRPYGAPP
jgi:CheY-like chemotaxis protein